MNQLLITSLIAEIKQKKELSGLNDSVIQEALKKYFTNYKIGEKELSEKERKIIVKEIRDKLRHLTGRFQASQDSRRSLLKKGKISDLLSTHTSTKERLDDYQALKDKISSLNINSILDLGCGINPIALASKDIEYSAADINEDDLKLVRIYFKLNHIQGNVFFYDLRELEKSLPKADLCLLFKVFDVLETKGHKQAEKIIKFIQCKYIMMSFSTKTLSGKPMNHPQRGWIERLLKRLNYDYECFKTKNEIFYLVSK